MPHMPHVPRHRFIPTDTNLDRPKQPITIPLNTWLPIVLIIALLYVIIEIIKLF